ncbi:MAG: hypothetical protein E6J56_07570 [Deltaproteobacteria bacterium]|nr:MAG: hypothetical protein E6J56_07570 [Deltaproteobacteria bacterium]
MAAITSGTFGVKTTSFGESLTAWLVAHVTPHVVVIVESPSYSTMAPSSVHGMPSVKSALQSRSNRRRLSVNVPVELLPFWMLPVPMVSSTRTTSPGLAKLGPPT